MATGKSLWKALQLVLARTDGRTTKHRLGRALPFLDSGSSLRAVSIQSHTPQTCKGSHKAAESPNNVEEHEHSQRLQVSALELCKSGTENLTLGIQTKSAEAVRRFREAAGKVHAVLCVPQSWFSNILTKPRC